MKSSSRALDQPLIGFGPLSFPVLFSGRDRDPVGTNKSFPRPDLEPGKEDLYERH